MGSEDCYNKMKKAKALFDWKTKDNRIEFVRGIIDDKDTCKGVRLAGHRQQSNMLKELSLSNCLIKIEDGSVKKGDIVEYITLKISI